MPLSDVHCKVLEQLVNTSQRPRYGRPRMLVKEVPAALNLEFVKGAAQFNVPNRLFYLPVELLSPLWVLSPSRQLPAMALTITGSLHFLALRPVVLHKIRVLSPATSLP